MSDQLDTAALELEAARTHLQARAASAIGALADVAGALDMRELNEGLERERKRLERDTFKVIVVGRFKTGKSTLLNALLASSATQDVEGHEAPLPMSDMPATPTLTRISYAEAPAVSMWTKAGKRESWSFDKFRNRARIMADRLEHKAFFDGIREFELGYPSTLCRAGVTLVDSPGDDEDLERTVITTEEFIDCDAAIILFNTNSLAGLSELEFAQEVIDSGAKTFILINRSHGRVVDEELRARTWNAVVEKLLGGEPYKKGADFAAHDIYFVDAKGALDAKVAASRKALDQSGLPAFVERLSRFLMNERYSDHLERHAAKANELSLGLSSDIKVRMKALTQDSDMLQARYARQQEELETIEERKARLPEIIQRYRGEVESALEAGFIAHLVKLRDDMPEAMKRHKLASTANLVDLLKSVVSSRRASNEAAQVAAAYLRDGIREWSNAKPDEPGAARILAPIHKRLVDEVSTQVRSMQRDMGAARFEMIGWTPEEGEEQAVDWNRRVIIAIAGLLVGDYGNVVSGGAIGLRGLAGGLTGMTVATWALAAALGVASGFIIVPAALAASILGSFLAGATGLESELKKIAVREALASLDQGQEKLIENLHVSTRKTFAEIEERVMREVGSLITQERQNVLLLVEDDRRSGLEKATMLNDLEADLARIAVENAALDDTVKAARALS